MIIGLIGLVWLLFRTTGLSAQNSWIPGPLIPGIIPLERIILHTDRDIYLAGESIWFSADYTLIPAGNSSQVSQVLYIELFNSQKDVIIREKFSLENRNASGCLTIPAEVATDAYLIRAYTHFQRNFPPESHTMKYLTIVNPDIPYQHKILTTNKIVIVPEGGDFITGLPNRAAIWVNRDLTGEAKNVQLIDQRQRSVAPVKIFPNGLGEFNFTPVDSLDYRLMLILENGDTLTESLPTDDTEMGFLPSVRRTQQGLMYLIQGTMSPHFSADDSLILCVKSAEYVTLNELTVHGQELPVQIQIPYPDSYKGILYLILKENTGAILHILPVFIPGESVKEISIESDKTEYLQRDPATIRLKLPSEVDGPMHVSVSVVKQGTCVSTVALLPSHYIQHPFLLHSLALPDMSISRDLNDQADLCMILYTPYVNTILFRSGLAEADSMGIAFLPEIRDVSISGQVVRPKSGSGIAGVPVILSVLDQSQFHMVKSNDQGRFVFPLNHLRGEQQLVLSPQPKGGQNVEILINQDFSSQFPEQLALMPSMDSSMRHVIEEAWINSQIMQMNPPLPAPVQPEEKADILFAEERQVVVLSDYIEMKNLYEVFWEIVPFVQIRKKKDHYVAQVTNDRMEVFEDPLILLDNVPVSSVDELLKIPPALVDRIESINSPYLHGDFVLNGVVMVYTKTDNFAGCPFPEGSVFLDYQTITPQATFPVYEYSTVKQKINRLPDFRNVLYWDPNLVLSEKSALFSFYTSDHCGEYDVIVRGISEGGLSYYGKASIHVTDRSR